MTSAVKVGGERLYKKAQPQDSEGRRPPEATPFDRFVALAGLMLWAASEQPDGKATDPGYLQNCISEKAEAVIQGIAGLLVTLSEKMLADESWRSKDGGKAKPLIWQISLNRKALPALVRSVPAVKADAATTLFKVKCGEIAWAVLDSGIDGDHPAFAKPGGGRRVKRSFNFANFRKIVNLSNSKPVVRKRNLEDLLKVDGLLLNPYGDCEKPAGDRGSRSFPAFSLSTFRSRPRSARRRPSPGRSICFRAASASTDCRYAS